MTVFWCNCSVAINLKRIIIIVEEYLKDNYQTFQLLYNNLHHNGTHSKQLLIYISYRYMHAYTQNKHMCTWLEKCTCTYLKNLECAHNGDSYGILCYNYHTDICVHTHKINTCAHDQKGAFAHGHIWMLIMVIVMACSAMQKLVHYRWIELSCVPSELFIWPTYVTGTISEYTVDNSSSWFGWNMIFHFH